MNEVTLTPEQLDAADVSNRHMDACIVAGPGSGKTTVLVEYFRRLHGTLPHVDEIGRLPQRRIAFEMRVPVRAIQSPTRI